MFAAIYIQDFALQSALRMEPELRAGAAAIVDAESKPPAILQATAVARAKGVAAGLTATQALARCPNIVLKNRSPVREQSATDILLQTAGAFSPYIESTGRGICTIALRGLRFEDETAMRRWAEKIVTVLSGFQLEARVGFASTPGLASLAAQAAETVLVVRDDSEGDIELQCPRTALCAVPTQTANGSVTQRREFLFSLPIEALNPPPETGRILALWGVNSIGAFLALGKASVAERLGPVAAALFDGVDVVRPLQLVSPPEVFAERVEFPCEIETTEPLLFVLRRLLEQLTKRLDLVYLVAAELEMWVGLSSGAQYTRLFKIPSPTNSLQVLFRMLETHLETLRTDSPIVALELEARPGSPDQHQFGLFEATLRNPNRFAETLARLTALCGAENVGTPRFEGTHRPDAFRVMPPDFSDRPEDFAREESVFARTGLQLRRFRPAVRAIVEFHGQQPAAIDSQAVQGMVRRVQGPFRNSGGWWDASEWAREEWDAETNEGVLCRIVRRAEGCFVEGVYD